MPAGSWSEWRPLGKRAAPTPGLLWRSLPAKKNDSSETGPVCLQNQNINDSKSEEILYHLDEQVLSAALDVFTHAALLGLVVVAAFAITDGDFSFVRG